MKRETYSFGFEVYESIADLEKGDADLLQEARTVAETAYAPYSHFFVGAAALLMKLRRECCC